MRLLRGAGKSRQILRIKYLSLTVSDAVITHHFQLRLADVVYLRVVRAPFVVQLQRITVFHEIGDDHLAEGLGDIVYRTHVCLVDRVLGETANEASVYLY